MSRELRALQGIGAHPVLREHERQYLRVKRAVLESDDAVHPDRNERTALALEYRRAEGPAGATKDILAGTARWPDPSCCHRSR